MAVVSGECGVGSWATENGGSGFGGFGDVWGFRNMDPEQQDPYYKALENRLFIFFCCCWAGVRGWRLRAQAAVVRLDLPLVSREWRNGVQL